MTQFPLCCILGSSITGMSYKGASHGIQLIGAVFLGVGALKMEMNLNETYTWDIVNTTLISGCI